MPPPPAATPLALLAALLVTAAGCTTAPRPADRFYGDRPAGSGAAVTTLALPLDITPIGQPIFLDRTLRQPSGDGGFLTLQSVTYTLQEDRQLAVSRGGIRRPRTGGLLDRTAFTQTIAIQQR